MIKASLRGEGNVGGSPTATHFSCFAKKSKQKKAIAEPLPAVGGFPNVATSDAKFKINVKVKVKNTHLGEVKIFYATIPGEQLFLDLFFVIPNRLTQEKTLRKRI
ncbi:hypothetical protein [Glaciimonas soli]|uniref:Uncharacterized protein n=1 Tax=Glaciimonas soli TaxID=2590999 RepID=A0A843YUY6_9BURK|nr:hypothetical protein [Glaciimonas soli]MQR01807.1 hypothetical protein [Glaciimonas soli]